MICGHCAHKHCSRCKQFKQQIEFAGNVKAKDGKQRWCRSCNSEYNTQRKITDWKATGASA